VQQKLARLAEELESIENDLLELEVEE